MRNSEVYFGDLNFDFAFGIDYSDINNAEFDIFNNPFIEIVGYGWDNYKNFGLNEYIDLEICSEERAKSIVDEFMMPLYPKLLCFKNTAKMRLKSNYLTTDNGYHFGYFIRYCKNTTENNQWCKTKDETDAWLEFRNHVFVHRETRVNKEIWADSPTTEDPKNYFPTISQQYDHNWGPLNLIKPNLRDKFYQCSTLFFSKNKLTIDDSILWPNPREIEFGNFVRSRDANFDRATFYE